eukprot:3500117-Pyramimonas_sp.AAC.1
MFTDAERAPELTVVYYTPIKSLHHWRIRFSPQIFADTTLSVPQNNPRPQSGRTDREHTPRLNG